MKDPRFDDPGMDDDFRPEDFSAAPPIRVADDFVARTLARIRADRERIAKDAEELEDPRLLEQGIPRKLLTAYEAPAPSPSFVDHTLDRVLRDRARSRARQVDDATLDRLLARYTPPRISADFVERTLAALSAEARQPTVAERSHGPAPRLRAVEPRPRARERVISRRWLAAAALLVLGLTTVLVFGRGASPTRTKGIVDLATSSAAPSAVHAIVSRELRAPRTDRPDLDLDLVPLDGLLVLAEGLGSRSE